MFRAIISPILSSTRLCLQLWCKAPMMLPAGDQDEVELYRPKHAELLKMLIKLSMLHLVCCLYYCT